MTAGYDEEVATKAINLWQSKLMPEREIRAALINGGPELAHIFSIWEHSDLRRLELTSVGIAIAHALLKARAGLPNDLPIWIH